MHATFRLKLARSQNASDLRSLNPLPKYSKQRRPQHSSSDQQYTTAMSDSESESTGDSSEFPSPPTDIDPYAVLSIPRTSTTPEIRTAYRRLALSIHPDKVPASERASAHIKFQQLAFAYAVLSDEARRARYDATGSTSESAFGGDGEAFDWKAFFRQQVKDLVSPEAVEKFKMEYQGSFFPLVSYFA